MLRGIYDGAADQLNQASLSPTKDGLVSIPTISSTEETQATDINAMSIISHAAFPIRYRHGDFDCCSLCIQCILDKFDYARWKRLDNEGGPKRVPRVLRELSNVASHVMLSLMSCRSASKLAIVQMASNANSTHCK